MAVIRVPKGVGAPNVLRFAVSSLDFDMRTVTLLTLQLVQQGRAVKTWLFQPDVDLTTEVLLSSYHTFAAADANTVGMYNLVANLTVPGGIRPVSTSDLVEIYDPYNDTGSSGEFFQ